MTSESIPPWIAKRMKRLKESFPHFARFDPETHLDGMRIAYVHGREKVENPNWEEKYEAYLAKKKHREEQKAKGILKKLPPLSEPPKMISTLREEDGIDLTIRFQKEDPAKEDATRTALVDTHPHPEHVELTVTSTNEIRATVGSLHVRMTLEAGSKKKEILAALANILKKADEEATPDRS